MCWKTLGADSLKRPHHIANYIGKYALERIYMIIILIKENKTLINSSSIERQFSQCFIGATY